MKIRYVLLFWMLTGIIQAGMFDVEPFPTPEYFYRVHNQSSIVASGALERAEAHFMLFDCGSVGYGDDNQFKSPDYAVRWGRPYSAYTRTLYSKYNLGNALVGQSESHNLKWLDKSDVNSSQPYYTTFSQFKYYTDLTSFLEEKSTADWYLTGSLTPTLSRMQLATDPTGLRGSYVMTNLVWNQVPLYWFEYNGQTLRITSNFNITLDFAETEIDTTVPREIDFGEALLEEPDPGGSEPYPPVPDWWIPWSEWSSDTAVNVPDGSLDWNNGITFYWTDRSNNVTDHYLAPGTFIPGAHYEPIFDGIGASQVWDLRIDLFVIPAVFKTPGDYGTLIYSAGAFKASAYGGNILCNGIRVDWDRAPVADGYVISDSDGRIMKYVDGQETLSAVVVDPDEYDFSLNIWNYDGVVMSVTNKNGITSGFEHDMFYSYNVGLSGHQWIYYRTPPLIEYAVNMGYYNWDFEEVGLWDIPFESWVVYNEGQTFGGLVSSNMAMVAIEAYKTISKRIKLGRLPVMSWDQEPLMDMYSRTNASLEAVFQIGYDQPWDTDWELLKSGQYPQDFGVVNMKPLMNVSATWEIVPVGDDACFYDLSVVYTGTEDIVTTEKKVTRITGPSTTNSISGTEIVYNNEIIYAPSLPEIEWTGSDLYPDSPSIPTRFVIEIYTLEEINGQKYRSAGTTKTIVGHIGFRIESEDHTTPCGIWVEALDYFILPNGTVYIESVIPVGGLTSEMPWPSVPEPSYPLKNSLYYVVTNEWTTTFTNCFTATYPLIADLEDVVNVRHVNPDVEQCSWNWQDIVWVPGQPVTYGWDYTWMKETFNGHLSTFTNVVTQIVDNGWAEWTNIYADVTTTGIVHKWTGTRWIPYNTNDLTNSDGWVQTNIDPGFANPEAYALNRWFQNVQYWEEGYSAVTGRPYMSHYQWNVRLDYWMDVRATNFVYQEFYTDPLNVLRWDVPNGFKVQ
jgi:hypothetical protein